MFKCITSAAIIFMLIALTCTFRASSEELIHSHDIDHPRDTIVISRVSTNPKKHFQHLKPIADYLAQNLSEYGIKKGKVLFANNEQQMIRYIKQGKVDLITETVFAATVFNKKAGADILLRRWKKGFPEYNSLIFTRADSGIDALEDLVGKTIAFQDRGSSSAFYIPAAILISHGFKLYELDTPREIPPADAIGYAFADKESNISAWVNKGIVDAGALSNLDWNNEDDMPTVFREENRVIYESPAFPRSVELVRPDLDPLLKQKIKDILLNAHNTDEGQKVLRLYQKTKKFDELSDADDGMALAVELQKIVASQQLSTSL